MHFNDRTIDYKARYVNTYGEFLLQHWDGKYRYDLYVVDVNYIIVAIKDFCVEDIWLLSYPQIVDYAKEIDISELWERKKS
jgi:hypothetical protein